LPLAYLYLIVPLSLNLTMDVLPSELADLLCYYLPTQSIKSIRRTCKSFAAIGEPHLFHNFEFRLFPSRHRLYQLEQLAVHPTIATRLETLTYESGVQLEYADYRYWRAQVYQEESSKFSRGITTDGISQDEYRKFHIHLDSRFPPDMGAKYALYREHLDQEATAMAAPEIIAVLSKTMQDLRLRKPSLKMKLVMLEPQITLDELTIFDASCYACELPPDVNPRWRAQKRRRNCLTHFTTFLEAAFLAKWEASDLAAINIPREILAGRYPRDIEVINVTFRTLQHLQLAIGELPHSDWLARGDGDIYHRGRNLAANRLARLLDMTKELRSLAIEFPSHSMAEYSFEIFNRTNIDRFPRLWLSGLQALNFSNIQCTWNDLKAALEAAVQVKALRLSDCRLETGSMVDLIHALRTMRLERVCLDGRWCVYDDDGEWHSHDEAIYTECPVSSYEGPYASKGLRNCIEKFIIEGGKCPLPAWTADGGEQHVWETAGDTSWHYIPFPH
jgi:hypothetical protein